MNKVKKIVDLEHLAFYPFLITFLLFVFVVVFMSGLTSEMGLAIFFLGIFGYFVSSVLVIPYFMWWFFYRKKTDKFSRRVLFFSVPLFFLFVELILIWLQM